MDFIISSFTLEAIQHVVTRIGLLTRGILSRLQTIESRLDELERRVDTL